MLVLSILEDYIAMANPRSGIDDVTKKDRTKF